jgi:hypothetical protein
MTPNILNVNVQFVRACVTQFVPVHVSVVLVLISKLPKPSAVAEVSKPVNVWVTPSNIHAEPFQFHAIELLEPVSDPLTVIVPPAVGLLNVLAPTIVNAPLQSKFQAALLPNVELALTVNAVDTVAFMEPVDTNQVVCRVAPLPNITFGAESVNIRLLMSRRGPVPPL